MRETGASPTPEFQSFEEEKKYWEARGPLVKGHKGRINKPKLGQKRSSFLAVRLTGEELTKLRDIAAKQGLGPSTFARLVLAAAIERQSRSKVVTLDQLGDVLGSILPQSVKDRCETLIRKSAIGDPDNPAMLIIDASQEKEYEEITLSLLKILLALIGIQVVIPEKENYQKLKEVMKSQA